MTDVLNWLRSDGAIKIIIAFTVAQIFNVIVATFKSVITIKGSKLMAAFLNGLSYAINALVIKQITGISNEVILITLTFITNFVGVYASLYILDRLKKDKLWIITVVIPLQTAVRFEEEITENNIKFSKLNYIGDTRSYMLYSKNKQESEMISKIMKGYSDIHYTVTTNTWEFNI